MNSYNRSLFHQVLLQAGAQSTENKHMTEKENLKKHVENIIQSNFSCSNFNFEIPAGIPGRTEDPERPPESRKNLKKYGFLICQVLFCTAAVTFIANVLYHVVKS